MLEELKNDVLCGFLMVVMVGAYFWLPLLVLTAFFGFYHNWLAAGVMGVIFVLGLWARLKFE